MLYLGGRSMLKTISSFCAFALLAGSIVLYQNCGSPSSSATQNQDASSNDDPVDTDGVTQIATKDCILNSITYQCVTISYGAHALQAYDLWLPNNPHVSGDRPLVVYIHGGGYYTGDKVDAYPAPTNPPSTYSYDKNTGMPELLNAGYAFATVGYRLVDDFPFVDGLLYPVQISDSAAALQDLRLRATHYGYNPSKVALTGVSAGAAISLWLAFHDDLIKATSSVPREKYSTRVNCVAVRDGQSTINMSEILGLLGSSYSMGHGIPTMFGFTEESYNANPTQSLLTYGDDMNIASPITHLSADDANVKVMLSYLLDYGVVPANIHAPEFGKYLALGSPSALATQFGRRSLSSLGIVYTLRVKQGAVLHKNNMINHINSCFPTAP